MHFLSHYTLISSCQKQGHLFAVGYCKSNFLLNVAFWMSGVALAFECPDWQKYGKPPPKSCPEPTDPLNMPKSGIEEWFTESIFNDLFPKANIGWGPSNCRPYNYKAFVIAARYFPKFGTEHVSNDPMGKKLNANYSPYETYRRDLSAFFAHAVQETGENNGDLYKRLPEKQAADCFYRGGFFNWFEGGPISPFVKNDGLDPTDGEWCSAAARYCDQGSNTKWFYPCAGGSKGGYYKVWTSSLQASENTNIS